MAHDSPIHAIHLRETPAAVPPPVVTILVLTDGTVNADRNADADQAAQLVPRQNQIDILQVAFASVSDDDTGSGQEVLGNGGTTCSNGRA